MEHLGYKGNIICLLVLSPLLFCIFLEFVTTRALDTEDIRTNISGSCLNNLKFIWHDIYMALLAESIEDLQDHKVDAESERFGLKISTTKTEVQCIAIHKNRPWL